MVKKEKYEEYLYAVDVIPCQHFLPQLQEHPIKPSHFSPFFTKKTRSPITHFMNSVALLLMSSTIYAVSSDCPNMVELARGFGMQTTRPAIWTALQGDCCIASGVTCDVSQRVTQISWFNIGLNGTINGTAIPSSVTLLHLYNNAAITGSIPSSLPSGLVELSVRGNQMSGDLPSFPSTLQYLALGYPGSPQNHFTGSLRLNRPFELYINFNWITDVVVQDSSGLSICNLSNNPLLGNPNIVGLTMCTQNGLYSASLLPNTKLTTALAKTTTTTFGTFSYGTTSSMGTVKFEQKLSGFDVNLGMVRVLISGMILSAVFMKTPYKREFKRMMNKEKTKITTSATEFK